MHSLGIHRLRSFVAVAEKGSISSAAAKVARTQSAVSAQMRQLEEMAGGPLFGRTRRGVRLTRKGERLLTHARTILAAHDRALAQLSGAPVAGDVRLGCPDDYARRLPAILGDFAADHPLIQIHLDCAPTPDLLQRVEEGALDLTVATLRRAKPGQRIRRDRLVWVAKSPAVAETAGPLPLALSHEEGIDRTAALDALGRARRDYNIVYESRSMTGLLAAVDAGIAVAVLSESIVPEGLAVLHRGLPRLPDIEMALVPAPGPQSDAVHELAERIRAAL